LVIDLRSDTVTRPTPEMRQAMISAPVGDDVFGDDPTVLELQKRVATLLDKEAALFTPTGTMANQLALCAQTQPGDEILADDVAHVSSWESGAGAALSGVQFRSIGAGRGGFGPEELASRVRPKSFMAPRTSLVATENTNNHRGGEIFPLPRLQDVSAWARENGLRVHMDGARLWNASVASGVPLRDYAATADSVSLCFSKGLGAPLGSILVSDAATISRAHRLRKMWGGGMRQVGIVAAAGLHALDHHVERLADDHRRAQRLGQAVQSAPGLELRHPVETNIVIVGVTGDGDSAEALVRDLRTHDVWAVVWEPRAIRLVTHLDIDDEQIETVVSLLQKIR
jgi:threonine aldolase